MVVYGNLESGSHSHASIRLTLLSIEKRVKQTKGDSELAQTKTINVVTCTFGTDFNKSVPYTREDSSRLRHIKLRLLSRDRSMRQKTYACSEILRMLLLFVGCLMSQQQASESQGRICSDNCTCCHTEIAVADQTVFLIQPQYTDIGPTSLSADPVTPGAWQGSHLSADF